MEENIRVRKKIKNKNNRITNKERQNGGNLIETKY